VAARVVQRIRSVRAGRSRQGIVQPKAD